MFNVLAHVFILFSNFSYWAVYAQSKNDLQRQPWYIRMKKVKALNITKHYTLFKASYNTKQLLRNNLKTMYISFIDALISDWVF